jgi:oligoendopeptidase F
MPAGVASVTIELLALPYLDHAQESFSSTDDARRAEIVQLEESPDLARLDRYHRRLPAPIDTYDGHDRDARDAAWIESFNRLDPGRDWSGAEAERLARWYRQCHLFLYPFSSIENGIARRGALWIWGTSLRDQTGAAAFRRALALDVA